MLNGKKVLLIGACGLIGSRCAAGIINQGAELALADIDEPALFDLNQDIVSNGGGACQSIHIDITSEDSVNTCLKKAAEKLGHLDAVINMAYPKGVNFGVKHQMVSFESFNNNCALHLGGYFNVLKHSSNFLEKQFLGGSIVSLSSIYGSVAPRFELYEDLGVTMPVEYAAIKAAIENLSRYFAKYYKKSNIRVNTLSPGGVSDDQHPDFVSRYNGHCGSLGMLDSEDLSEALVFLISDGARALTGQNIVIDDGFSL